MTYAAGRPLWMLSLATWDAERRSVPVLRWSPTIRRQIEAVRDRILMRLGTNEPMIEESAAMLYGERAISIAWRKPLSIEEINRMAPTPEVKARPGRA
jgi:hypothetical protein